MSWAEEVRSHLVPVREAIATKLAAEMVDEIVDVMKSASPSGYTDEEGYRSSAPGEPPAYGHGAYARSWDVSGVQSDAHTSQAAAFSAMRDRRTGRLLGEVLEWGDEVIDARPHIRVAIDRMSARARAVILEINR